MWSHHWHAWRVFLAMGTQWRTRRDPGGLFYEGLEYAGLPVVLQEHRRALPRRLRQPLERVMPQLRVLERAAAAEFNRADD